MRALTPIIVAAALGASGVSAQAREPVVVIVAAHSTLRSLSAQDLADLYLGRISRWPSGGVVELVDLAEGHPIRDVFYRRYLGRTGAQIRAHWSRLVFTGRGRPPRQAPEGPQVVALVAANPDAIGYVEPEYVDARVRVIVVGVL